jgi:hypothetical protein
MATAVTFEVALPSASHIKDCCLPHLAGLEAACGAFQHLPNTWPEPKKSQNHFLIYDPFDLAFFDNKNAFHHVHGRGVGEICIDVEKKYK